MGPYHTANVPGAVGIHVAGCDDRPGVCRVGHQPRKDGSDDSNCLGDLLGCCYLCGDQHTGGARGFHSADMAHAARRARAVSRFHVGICDRIQRLSGCCGPGGRRRSATAAGASAAAIGEYGVGLAHCDGMPGTVGLFSVLFSTFPAFDSRPEEYENVECSSVGEVLADAGYRTAMFHSGRFGYLGMEAIIHRRGYQTLEDASDIGGNHNSSFGVDEPATVVRILAWIDGLPRGQRFFLTYLPIAGHHPYATPEHGPFAGTAEIDQYRNALNYGDASLGALIEGLRVRGLEQNTVWVVYGDHGEAFHQHEGNYGHTFLLYDENVHVPFLIAAAGLMRRQERVRKWVSLVDVAPTILDLMGIPSRANHQGRTMLDGAPRMALFFADYSLGLLGLRDGPWKFVYEVGSGRAKL